MGRVEGHDGSVCVHPLSWCHSRPSQVIRLIGKCHGSGSATEDLDLRHVRVGGQAQTSQLGLRTTEEDRVRPLLRFNCTLCKHTSVIEPPYASSQTRILAGPR